MLALQRSQGHRQEHPLNGLPIDQSQQPFESPLFMFLASRSKPGCQKKTQQKHESWRPVTNAPPCWTDINLCPQNVSSLKYSDLFLIFQDLMRALAGCCYSAWPPGVSRDSAVHTCFLLTLLMGPQWRREIILFHWSLLHSGDIKGDSWF